jgi:hypothetical protein
MERKMKRENYFKILQKLCRLAGIKTDNVNAELIQEVYPMLKTGQLKLARNYLRCSFLKGGYFDSE